MKFRTEIKLDPAEVKMDYHSGILFMGSCFSENVGNLLKNKKFDALINPFGILYNPASVSQALGFILDEKVFNEQDLIFHNERWNSFFHHGSFSSNDKDEALEKMNRSRAAGRKALEESDFLFLSFGTAYVYEYLEKKIVVANCHKLPSQKFNRYLLGVNDILTDYSSLIGKMKSINPGLQIIFTVSPVRHWKDGAIGNQLSKSILHVSIHELTQKFRDTDYFPSYELLMDDLRDYRFYDKDLLHPNPLAVDYIFEKFADRYMSSETLENSKLADRIRKAREHRAFNTSGEAWGKFCRSGLELIHAFNQKTGTQRCREEEAYFTQALK